MVDADHPLRTLIPDDALGAAVDGMQRHEVRRLLTPRNVALMKSAGLRRVTYRTRPELGIEAWHWTDKGRWSDAAHAQGYWTGDPASLRTPDVTFGYSLPRRGNSIDQANDTGYSRLDDGDETSFWKSNPYLDRRYTHLASNRPQWILVCFQEPVPIDALRLAWGAPSARRFEVQYWTGSDEQDAAGRWTPFPHGVSAAAADGADQTLRLADAPIPARFVRVMLYDSSETGPPGSRDIRDRLGFAVREMGLGFLRPDGSLADLMRHGTDKDEQTQINVSSTDPWHRAIDRDPDTEQPGLDLMFRLGLNGGKPLMVPVGTFYDTPENAAAEIAYLRRRGFPVRQVELGEEPDGQFIAGADYADLYLQSAEAIGKVAPDLMLGGPSLQGIETTTWPMTEDGRFWTGAFIARLRERGAMDRLQFFSFEHYAFDDVCYPIGGMLRDETQLLDRLLDEAQGDGVPRDIPWIISEYGFSPFSGRAMSEVSSALLSADIVGNFLTRGGSAAYMFGYTPGSPANQVFPCAGYGDMMLFEADAKGRSVWPMPMYFAQRMMMRDWAAPSNQPHALLRASAQSTDADGRPFVTAYVLRASDGALSVMLINRDEHRAHLVRLVLRQGAADRSWPSQAAANRPWRLTRYDPSRYTWLDADAASHPVKDEPPLSETWSGEGPLTLPALSLSVLGPTLPAPAPAAKGRRQSRAPHAHGA